MYVMYVPILTASGLYSSKRESKADSKTCNAFKSNSNGSPVTSTVRRPAGFMFISLYFVIKRS